MTKRWWKSGVSHQWPNLRSAASESRLPCQFARRIPLRKPDLVFLDVQMPECDGFDVIEMLRGDAPCVIFVTAYDNYELCAFEVSALDCLLKPFD